ncbi:hypothetical protein C8J57DRAFT_1492710 [Mycena rebaudengoi]|nr:hypothetical protein C8J57DRAFT_1492710 [Mycena rebaudengoi]
MADSVRSPDFWFTDGNIVLNVENTIYRVYRGLLCSRSNVFMDTFSIPQPAGDSSLQMFDGCPVVQLHDKAVDFTPFLKALHQCQSAPISNFEELSAILRLSDKYDVPALRDAMISILSAMYPFSLDAWVKRTPPPGYQKRPFEDFYILNLARRFDIRHILPGVMYEVSRYGMELIYSGVPDVSVSVDIMDEVDRKKIILAVPGLLLAQRRIYGCLVRVYRVEDCVDRHDCDAERFQTLADILALDDQTMNLFDPDYVRNLRPALCAACLEDVKTSCDFARYGLWATLPRVFDLAATWEELLKDRHVVT